MGSSSQTITTNQDRRVTTDSGTVLGLFDAPLTIGNGSTVSLSIADPSIVTNAFDALQKSTTAAFEQINSTTKQLAQGSNNIAAEVAKSQEQFVATASGQRWLVYAIGIVALIAGGWLWLKIRKRT